jgi:hypothetical protein
LAAPTYNRSSTYAALAPGTSRDIPYPSIPQAGEVIFLFLSNLSNPDLLSALDLALLELGKRLFRYAKVGPELLEMADEGLVLAARAKARLGVPPARALRGTPSLASRRRRTRSSRAGWDARCASALFTQVPRRGILRTSPVGGSRNFATSSNAQATAKIRHMGDALMPPLLDTRGGYSKGGGALLLVSPPLLTRGKRTWR